MLISISSTYIKQDLIYILTHVELNAKIGGLDLVPVLVDSIAATWVDGSVDVGRSQELSIGGSDTPSRK
jgi:hypothetical protein